MTEERKTQAELHRELRTLRERVAALEATQEALRESEERYRSFVDNFHGIAYRGRTHFVPVFFHGAVEEITGYTPEELTAGTFRWNDLIHADDWPSIAESAEKIRSVPGYSCEREYRITRKDGETRWIREFSQNVCDDSGKPEFVQGALYDVTDRKRIEDALRESERRFRAVFNSSGDAVFVHDMEGHFLEVNELACEHLGYRREELLEMTPAEIDAPEYAPLVPERIREIQTHGEAVFETAHVRRDGTIVPVEITSRSFVHGGVPAVLSVARDISERKLAEGVARQTTERLRALHEIDQAILAAESPADIAQAVVARMRELLPCHRASVALFDFDADEAIVLAASVKDETALGAQERFSLAAFEQAEPLRRGEVHCVPDLQAVSEPSPVIRKLLSEGIRSYVNVPLLSSADLVGSLNIGANVPGGFSDLQIEVARQVAAPLAIAIQQARLRARVQRDVQELGQRARELTALNRLGSEVRASLSVSEVTTAALDNLQAAVDPDVALLYLRLGNELRLEGARQNTDAFDVERARVTRVGHCLCGLAASGGEAVYAFDITHDPRCTLAECKDAGLRSFAALPLRGQQGILGVLGLASTEPRDFQKQASFLDTLASEIAIGLQNALLYAEVRRHAERLQTTVAMLEEQERALRDSERKYRELYEGMRDGSAAVDMNGTIVQFNQAFQQMLGYSRDEIDALTYRDITPDKWHETEARIIDEQVMARGYSDLYEKEYRRKDGTIFPVELRTYLLRDEDSEPAGMWAFVRDISERKRMEARLRAAERMEVMGQLASGVAHEVRNPLNAILAIAQALHERLGEDPQYKPHVDHIRGQVDRLARLMQDLLDFAKPIQTDRLVPVSVLATCASAIDLWRQSRPRVTHHVELVKAPKVHGVQVLGDSARLEQVLLNLLDNAAQHSPEGSKIQVVVPQPDESLARIHVVDEGTGMSSDNLPKVFEPFFSTRTEGTGLGMSIVAHIVQAYRGDVTVRNNEPPPGCTVEIRLPVVA